MRRDNSGLNLDYCYRVLRTIWVALTSFLLSGSLVAACEGSFEGVAMNGGAGFLTFEIGTDNKPKYAMTFLTSNNRRPKGNRVSIQLDGNELFFGAVKFDQNGHFAFPPRLTRSREWAIGIRKGKDLIVLFDDFEDALFVDVTSFQSVRAAVIACSVVKK